jgi:hypothetical protein
MANVASQVIFHPAVSQGLKFGGTTVGRDKVHSERNSGVRSAEPVTTRLTELSNILRDSTHGILPTREINSRLQGG